MVLTPIGIAKGQSQKGEFTCSKQFVTSYDTNSSRLAANITVDALRDARNVLRTTYEKPITQRQLANHIESVMRSLGADAALAFPTLVMSGPELVEPHGDMTDDSSHFIDPSIEDVVMIDMGCKVNGYCADITRTFFFDNVDEEVLDAYRAVLAAHEAVMNEIAPGVSIQDLDGIVRSHLTEYLSDSDFYFHPIWGHGVGRFVHTKPYLYSGNTDILTPGSVLAIEPGLWSSDGWAVRVEDMVLVTNMGFELLSHIPREVSELTIDSAEPVIDPKIFYWNYEYNQQTFITIDLEGNTDNEIINVEYHDGYQWNSMIPEENDTFSYSYDLDHSYSSQLYTIIRCITNQTAFYFSEMMIANMTSEMQFIFEEPVRLEGTGDTLAITTLNHSNAELIRFRMQHYDAPDWDQALLLDSRGATIEDYRNRSGKYWWTPWATGNNISLVLPSTGSPSEGGLSPFNFTIDAYEVILSESDETETTTTMNSPTNTTSTTSQGMLEVVIFGSVVSVGVITVLVIIKRFRLKS